MRLSKENATKALKIAADINLAYPALYCDHDSRGYDVAFVIEFIEAAERKLSTEAYVNQRENE